MGPPKQRGRPIKIDKNAGLPAAKQVPKRWHVAGLVPVEFDEDKFLKVMSKHRPQPSDHVPPARVQQQQSEPPQSADEPADIADDSEAASNNSLSDIDADTDMDADTETGDDFEFYTVGGDAPQSKHHLREQQKFIDFNNHKAGMLAKGHIVQLSTQDCSEQVTCYTCSSHNISLMLMGLGFMVNRVAKPDHTFAIPIVQVALKARIHGTSYESCTGIFFSDSLKSARNKGLYQPFMDAVHFFSGLSQAVQHGTVHAPDTLSWGKTVCPMCEGNGDGEYPFVLKQMDGFESARKRAVEYGGGHNHGHYSWARQFWYEPGEDHVARAKEDRSLAKKRNQQSQYDRIIHQGCMHNFFERIFMIQMIRKQYPNRELALSYDVICKEVAHLQQPYMQQTKIEMPYIAVLPVMHAQAHSKEYQVKFSPRIIAGLGTKLDGEGVERENSRLAKSIGLTAGETEGNQEQDILLIAEDYNCSKLRSALKTRRK
ncbi:hypothetical protein BJ741DRAFT_702515 [Chytriomyces cf. hyalinus JEL632]|nr:hypothetical protein BJ741DRAFT_702515 [Chytriomyces cf. hyalinus JEL632]